MFFFFNLLWINIKYSDSNSNNNKKPTKKKNKCLNPTQYFFITIYFNQPMIVIVFVNLCMFFCLFVCWFLISMSLTVKSFTIIFMIFVLCFCIMLLFFSQINLLFLFSFVWMFVFLLLFVFFWQLEKSNTLNGNLNDTNAIWIFVNIKVAFHFKIV